MTAIIDAGELAAATKWAARGLPARPQHPVLTGMLLSSEDGRLTARAYDYELSAMASASAEGDLERVLVSGKLLTDITADLKGHVRLSLEDRRLVIEVGKHERHSLLRMQIEDYPSTPAVADPDDGVSDFDDVVARVITAASMDPENPVKTLTALHLRTSVDELVMVATDNYRMTVARVPWSGPSGLVAAVPAKRLQTLARDLGDKVGLGFGAHLSLTAGGRVATVGLLDEKAPAIERHAAAMIEGSEHHLTVEKAEFAAAVKKAALYVGPMEAIALEFSEDAITISGEQDTADGRKTIEAQYAGPEWVLGARPSYLADAIASIPGDVVHLALPGNDRSTFVFRAATEIGGEPDDAYIHLLMPQRLLGGNR